MTATLVVSETVPSARSLLKHQPLLLARARFTSLVMAPHRRGRTSPAALVLHHTDDVSTWLAATQCAASTPVLLVGDDHDARAESLRETVFFVTPTTMGRVVPSFLAAIDPAIVLIDSMLSASVPARSSATLLVSATGQRPPSTHRLTGSERDALYLLLSGHSSKEAAERLEISTSSFDKRVGKLHASLGYVATHELIVALFWQSISALGQLIEALSTPSRPLSQNDNVSEVAS